MKKLFIILLVAVSCTKDNSVPLKISDVEININYDKTHQYSIKKGDKEVKNITWEVKDNTIGSISATGLFTARKVGSTYINASYGGSIVQGNVNIIPYSTMLLEPVVKFGSSMSDIKYLEKRKFITSTATGMLFEGDNSKIENVLYLFEKGKLTSIGVIFALTTSVAKESILFYQERYPRRETVEDLIVHFNDAKTYSVALGIAGSDLVALYSPFDSNKREATGMNQYNQIKQFIKNYKQ